MMKRLIKFKLPLKTEMYRSFHVSSMEQFLRWRNLLLDITNPSFFHRQITFIGPSCQCSCTSIFTESLKRKKSVPLIFLISLLREKCFREQFSQGQHLCVVWSEPVSCPPLTFWGLGTVSSCKSDTPIDIIFREDRQLNF